MHRKAIVISLAAVAFAASLAAKPNFSGTWTLNVSKSDFGMLPGPTSRTDVIDHNDPMLKDAVTQETQQGPQNAALSYTTDGKEVTNQQGPLTVKSTLGWEGDNLVVNSSTSLQGNDITIKQVWTLSADQKSFTQKVHFAAAAMGETDQVLVFEKGAGGAAPAPTATASASTGARANYSGTWKLNVDKSDFGPLPPSNSRTDIIEHSEPTLKDTVSDDGAQGKLDYVLKITTDGKEAINNAGGLDTKSTASWSGSNLVVDTKLSFQGTDVAIKTAWVLSPDGKTLIQNAHLNAGPLGEVDQKFVFEKQ